MILVDDYSVILIIIVSIHKTTWGWLSYSDPLINISIIMLNKIRGSG